MKKEEVRSQIRLKMRCSKFVSDELVLCLVNKVYCLANAHNVNSNVECLHTCMILNKYLIERIILFDKHQDINL